MQTAKGILFDFDGVIGETMEDNYKAWLFALSQYGCTFTKEEYFQLEGMRVSKIAENVLTKFGKDPVHGAEIAKLKDSYYNENNTFRFADGVSELISNLKKNNIPFGLVSGGARQRLINKNTEEVLSHFSALVTADDCKIGKPDAEPYLIGAQKLGLKPEECVVVENAPLGVEAAKAAGMFCIALCTTLSENFLQKADTWLPDFHSLLNILTIEPGKIMITN